MLSRLHRQPKHVLAFLLAELGTSGSVDGNNQLIIKGNLQMAIDFRQRLIVFSLVVARK